MTPRSVYGGDNEPVPSVAPHVHCFGAGRDHTGNGAPHQPTPEWIDKFKGKFDMGWNELREQIFANQKRLGVIPANTTLTPWPDGQPEYGGAKLAKWDALSADEKKLFARQAEVFAAYVAYTDHEIGRVIQEVEDEGKLDNTLVIYISGDNGTSAEGTTLGTPFDVAALQGIEVPVADQLKFYDVWGSPQTTPHMAVASSWAFESVLLRLKASGMLDEYPNLSAYVARGEARPAYKRAFDAQLAVNTGKQPTG